MNIKGHRKEQAPRKEKEIKVQKERKCVKMEIKIIKIIKE